MSQDFSLSASVFVLAFSLTAGGSLAEEIDLEAVRIATQKYQDINVALADGYIRDPSNTCVSAAAEGLPAEWGAMGLHYIHPGKLGITGDQPRVDVILR